MRAIQRIGLLVLIAGTVAVSCLGQSAIDERLVAEVNGIPISVQRFKGTYVDFLIRTGADDTRENRYRHLENLVSTYLLGLEAERLGLGEEKEVRTYIDRQTKRIVGSRYLEVEFSEQLPEPSDAELREVFRKSKETRVVRQLSFRTPQDAEAAHTRLKNGTDFLDLAMENSGTADSTAGLVGEVEYFELDDSISEVVFSIPLDSVSAPFRSRNGWHIVRVENRFYDPLLTEDEYQLRKDNLRFQMRRRRFIIDGDSFVRSEMSKLNVRVNAAAIETVHNALVSAISSDGPSKRITVTSKEVSLASDALSGDTILLEYTSNGQNEVYSYENYLNWLDGLPVREVVVNTAASVGRALRNDVFAERGFTLGLDSEPFIQDEIRYYKLVYLANAAEQALAGHEGIDPTDDEIKEAFERLNMSAVSEVLADYWTIHATSHDEANAVLENINAGQTPESYSGFSRANSVDISTGGGASPSFAHHFSRSTSFAGRRRG